MERKMNETFEQILAAGGKSNSLGRSAEVITAALSDKTRLDELYGCLFSTDPWVKMRGADALEKICRVKPEWISRYVDQMQVELLDDEQPSVQWHLAQIYAQVALSSLQKNKAITWLSSLVATTEVDWIVSANVMKTLVQFTQDGSVPRVHTIRLLKVQQAHKSKSVVRRATKLLAELDP